MAMYTESRLIEQIKQCDDKIKIIDAVLRREFKFISMETSEIFEKMHSLGLNYSVFYQIPLREMTYGGINRLRYQRDKLIWTMNNVDLINTYIPLCASLIDDYCDNQLIG